MRRIVVLHPALGAALLVSACAHHNEPALSPPPAPAASPGRQAPLTSAPARPQTQINGAGLAIVRESEGLHLKAYQDAGQWLIGDGHADGAGPGQSITSAEAEAALRRDLALCETKTAAALTRPASSNEFSAMVSLCYTIGWQPFTASALVRHFNAGETAKAGDAFLDWTKAMVDGRKTVLQRLADRRARERALFLTSGPPG